MNAVRRQKPTISPDDVERLLFHLEDARDYIVKYGSAQGFNSQANKIAQQATSAIDDLAGQITGNKQYLWQSGATAGGSDWDFQRGKEKEVKRRRLMGVQIPIRIFKLT